MSNDTSLQVLLVDCRF